MNIRDLSYLVALDDWRHFSRAAEAVHVTQPTLSMQIKKLEAELGVQLVERARKELMLTPAGIAIVARARVILREAHSIKEIAKRGLDPGSGPLRLGVFPTLAPYLLPHVVPSIVKCFPRIELYLTEEKTDLLLAMLKDGKLDAAVLALPIDERTLSHIKLFDEPFVYATPKATGANKTARLRLADLAERDLLLLEDGHCMRDQALEVCARSGANELGGFRATSLETLRQMVAAGMGSTLLPKLATLAPVAQSDHVQLRYFAAPEPHRSIGLVWRKSSEASAFMQKLGECLAEPILAILK